MEITSNNQNNEIGIDRRHYPKTFTGGKDEWQGIQQHQREFAQNIAVLEQQAKAIKSQELRDDFLQSQINKLKGELEKKEKIYQEQLEYQKNSQQQLAKINEEQKAEHQLKNLLYNDYQNKMKDKQMMRNLIKQNQINEEQQQLQMNKEIIKQIQLQQAEQKMQNKEEALTSLKLQEMKKQQDQLLKLQEQQNYQNLIQENIRKELLKEQNYRNYYLNCNLKQQQKVNQHQQTVYKQYEDRQNQLNSFVESNFLSAEKARLQDELNRLRERQESKITTNSELKRQMAEKQYLRDLERLDKEQKQQQRIQELTNYKNYLEMQRKERLENQNQIKNDLDRQLTEKIEIQKQALRMTKEEKKINQDDLKVAISTIQHQLLLLFQQKAYKVVNPSLYSMVPGLSPQIGCLTRQRQSQLLNQIISRSSKQNDFDNSLVQDRSSNNIFQVQQPLRSSSLNQYYEREQQSSMPYNVITNPMPKVIQNPYVLKQLRMTQKSANPSVFQSLGNNIIGQQQQFS